MVAKIMSLFGSSDPDIAVAVDAIIKKHFRSSEFRKDAVYDIAFGKTPPHSEEIEAAFLGCCLLNPEKAVPLNISLDREHFYVESNAKVWLAMKSMSEAGELITPVSVSDRIKSEHIDRFFIEDLMFGNTDWKLSEEYSKKLVAYYVQRKSLEYCMDGAMKLLTAPLESMMDIRSQVAANLTDIAAGQLSGAIVDSPGMAHMLLSHAEMMKKFADMGVRPDWALGPIDDLNNLTGGWKPSDLIIIAGRPGMGKTALMMSEVNYAVKNQEPVGVFSLEMSTLQLVIRLLLMNSMVSNESMRTGKISNYEMKQIQNFASNLCNYGLYVDDTAGIDIGVLEERAMVMREKHGIKRLYVDYLQQVTYSGAAGNREQEVSKVATRLKGLAKRLSIPVIALAQLSRAPETRGGSMRPTLKDLRESGGIEQDADFVGFVYRPQYYGINIDEDGNEIKWSEIIGAKHRNGPTGNIKALFLPERMEWTNFAQEAREYNPLDLI